MRKYLKPLSLAIVVNLLIVLGVLHTHFSEQSKKTRRNITYINAHFNELAKPNNIKGVYNKHDITWLKQHYGKEIAIKRSFTAGRNLAGYVVSLKSDPEAQSLIYSVNHGEYYLVGTVIDKHGKNMTIHDTHHYISQDINKHIYYQSQMLKGIMQGNHHTPEITIIIDPNSNLFPEQWNNVEYDVKQGVFSVKWVLVNYLKPMGPNVASDILQAKNKVAVLSYNAQHYQASSQTGGYIKNLPITSNIRQELMHNWSFIQKYALYKLPITVVKSHGHYYVLQGVVIDETLEGIIKGED